MPDLIDELRRLIIDSAPDPKLALPVKTCGADEPLDGLIPFSSVIVLGVVVAIEDKFKIPVTRRMLESAFKGGITLRKLGEMIELFNPAPD